MFCYSHAYIAKFYRSESNTDEIILGRISWDKARFPLHTIEYATFRYVRLKWKTGLRPLTYTRVWSEKTAIFETNTAKLSGHLIQSKTFVVQNLHKHLVVLYQNLS